MNEDGVIGPGVDVTPGFVLGGSRGGGDSVVAEAAGEVAGHDDQSSTRRSGTLLKSARLRLRRVASRDKAIAAIRKSIVPMRSRNL